MDNKLVVINLMGGPGCGKSTIAAGLFSKLKKMGIECELVTEFAKDKVWDENYKILSDQIYVFGKQQHRLYRLNGKVDIAITDSPLLLSIIYDQSKSPELRSLAMQVFRSYDNHVFYINRNVSYVDEGRCQNADEAKEIDIICKTLMQEENIKYEETTSTEAEEYIINHLKENGII